MENSLHSLKGIEKTKTKSKLSKLRLEELASTSPSNFFMKRQQLQPESMTISFNKSMEAPQSTSSAENMIADEFISSNPFNVLFDHPDNQDNSVNIINKTPVPIKLKKPQPIILHKLPNDHIAFTKEVNKIATKGCLFKYVRGTVKILINDHDEKLKVIDTLKEVVPPIPFHTFTEKTNKPVEMVLRGLPDLNEVKDIQSEFLDKNINVTNVVKMQGTKQPCYKINFENGTEMSDIRRVNNVFGWQAYWAKYHKRNNHTMCFRCQGHGHAQRNCFAPPKCVKCAGDHLTLHCLKPKDTPAKCANCGGDHTANYRLCESYLKYVEFLFNKNKPKIQTRYINAPIPKSNPWQTGPKSTPDFHINQTEFPALRQAQQSAPKEVHINPSRDSKLKDDMTGLLQDLKEINQMINITEMAGLVHELKLELQKANSKIEKFQIFSKFAERLP